MKRGAMVLIAAFVLVVGSNPSGAAVTRQVETELVRPLLVTAPPGEQDRLFIVEQDGVIRIFKEGAVLDTPFLDLSALTRSPADGGNILEGLLGLAFHPDYESNHFFFVYHTDSTGANDLVVRYECDASDPDRADASTRTVMLTIPHGGHRPPTQGLRASGPKPQGGVTADRAAVPAPSAPVQPAAQALNPGR